MSEVLERVAIRRAGQVVSLAAVLTVGGFAAAKADVVTWNPSATVPALASTANAGPFSFDQLKVANFSRIELSGSGPTLNFNEGGFLDITQASLAGHVPQIYTPNGLGTAYTLYATFTATGTTSAPDFTTPQNNSGGTFNNITLHLFGVSGPENFTPPTTTTEPTPIAGSILLGTASLIDGATSLTVTQVPIGPNNCSPGTQGVPGVGRCLQLGPSAAPVDLNLTPSTSAAASGFFVNPASSVKIELANAFTNDFPDVTLINSSTVSVNNGGGTLTPFFQTATPEPASLAVLGMSLVGLGVLRRRKRS